MSFRSRCKDCACVDCECVSVGWYHYRTGERMARAAMRERDLLDDNDNREDAGEDIAYDRAERAALRDIMNG
jgi:hypothetical protein